LTTEVEVLEIFDFCEKSKIMVKGSNGKYDFKYEFVNHLTNEAIQFQQTGLGNPYANKEFFNIWLSNSMRSWLKKENVNISLKFFFRLKLILMELLKLPEKQPTFENLTRTFEDLWKTKDK